ncbi:ATP-binding protein [Actinospica robiniae]|uniref:ATP-binding protein n=1 Tax=Actinospica robiniae TaxID=304901 RepID=UPI0004052786|nr:AAA family ATPase [Actinospica robiniae]
MDEDGRLDPPRIELASVSSILSGTAGEVLQARDISGGVHFHGGGRAAMVPGQLPADVRGFVGREAVLARLAAAIEPGSAGPAQVLVLVGTAGVGKSALAVRFAHRVRSRFVGGQLFVNLCGYDAVRPLDPSAVLGRFLQALGAAPRQVPAGMEERAGLYRSLLADRRVLVVLDNAATVGQVRPLLPGGAGCLVVVTSRSRLSGLAARDGALRVPVGLLTESEAVELVAVTTGPYRSGDPPEALVELARLCARLPLALRIAGERAAARPMMPLETLIGQLREESSLWQVLSAEDETEADAVRTVFAWSYRALPPAAARAFRLLGLFPGPHVGIECAAALLGETAARAGGLLDVLAGAHLIEQSGPARYQFHDLLRTFAAEQARAGEAEEKRCDAVARAVRWYLHTAHAAGQKIEDLRAGVVDEIAPFPAAAKVTGRQDAAAWYQAEQANLAPIARAAREIGLDAEAWRLAVSLGPLHATAGSVDEWLEITQIGLEAAVQVDDRLGQAHVLLTRASALMLTGRPAQAGEALGAAREVFAEADDVPRMIDAENRLGLLHRSNRDLGPAGESFRSVLAQAVDAGLTVWQGVAQGNLADLAETGGWNEDAAARASDALALFEDAGADRALSISSLLVLARIERAAGRIAAARQFSDRAEAGLAETGANRWLEYAVNFEKASEELAAGRTELALEGYWRCCGLARSLGERQREARTLTAIGQALTRLGRGEEAIDFLRTAVAVGREHATAFDTAGALAGLAEACEDGTERASLRAEAVRLLERYEDPAAANLRAHLLSDG